MQVILKRNVPSLGKKGELKNVKDGYFMNYLSPRGLAEVATPEKVKAAEAVRQRAAVQSEKIKEQAGEIREKLKGMKVVIKAKAKGDKLYGSITEKEVLKALQEKLGVQLGKEHLLLSEHIKVLGVYEVPVRLVEGVEGKFTLEVKAEK